MTNLSNAAQWYAFFALMVSIGALLLWQVLDACAVTTNPFQRSGRSAGFMFIMCFVALFLVIFTLICDELRVAIGMAFAMCFHDLKTFGIAFSLLLAYILFTWFAPRMVYRELLARILIGVAFFCLLIDGRIWVQNLANSSGCQLPTFPGFHAIFTGSSTQAKSFVETIPCDGAWHQVGQTKGFAVFASVVSAGDECEIARAPEKWIERYLAGTGPLPISQDIPANTSGALRAIAEYPMFTKCDLEIFARMKNETKKPVTLRVERVD